MTATSDPPNGPCRQTPTLRPPHGSRPSARYPLAKPQSGPPTSSMDQHTASHRAITSARTAARPKTSNRQRNRQTSPGRESPLFFAVTDSVEMRTEHGSKWHALHGGPHMSRRRRSFLTHTDYISITSIFTPPRPSLIWTPSSFSPLPPHQHI